MIKYRVNYNNYITKFPFKNNGQHCWYGRFPEPWKLNAKTAREYWYWHVELIRPSWLKWYHWCRSSKQTIYEEVQRRFEWIREIPNQILGKDLTTQNFAGPSWKVFGIWKAKIERWAVKATARKIIMGAWKITNKTNPACFRYCEAQHIGHTSWSLTLNVMPRQW